MKLVAGLSLTLVLLSLCAKSAHATPAAQDPKAAVARIDGAVVTEGDLAAEVKVPLAAAEARFAEEVWGMKRRALVAREVTSNVPEPDDSQLQSVYDQTKASGRQLPPFPEVRAEIARYLKGEQTQQVRQAYVARLKAESKVQITFPPYWDMHDVLFANQNALQASDLKAHARKLGLDAAKFDACLDSGRMAARVDEDRKAGEALGLNGTPTFFVDGRPYVGSRPFETFQEVIDHILAAKR